MDTVDQKIEILRKKQTELSNILSLIAIQTILIFGVPAVCGYFLGVWLEEKGVLKVVAYGTPLLGTFFLSWFILLRKIKSINKEVFTVEEELRRLVPPKVFESKTNREDSDGFEIETKK